MLYTEDSLASKGFVDFKEIDILERHTARSRTGGMACAGPTPMMRGGTPTVEAETNLPRMGRPRRLATERRASRTAAAPCHRQILVMRFLRTEISPYSTDKNEKIKWCIEEEYVLTKTTTHRHA